jgi:hypothetical protein
VNIEACVFFRIINSQIANYLLEDMQLSISLITYAALRIICGENSLQDIL